ncbi:MAG: glycosyltransferase family 4 protein [Bacteroidia bacterium]
MNKGPSTLKIGFDAKRLFLNKSGLGNYSRWLVNGLIKEFPENQYHLYTTNISEVQNDFKGENIHTHLPNNLFKTFWRTKGIKKDLLKDKIQVYHGLSNELPLGIEKTGIKTVVTIHDLIFKIYPEYYNPIDRAIYDRKFKSACERADKIVAISQHTKESIVEFYKIDPEKVEVIYLDSSERFHHPADDGKVRDVKQKYGLANPFFLNVGAIGRRKNQLRLVEAFASVANEIEHDLVLVGKAGKDIEAIKLVIDKNNLNKRIKHFPTVNDEDLFNFYHASYASIYPSLYEGFGIPIIESYRCGKPVVTSIGSSLEEIAGKSSLLCQPEKTESIAEQILKLTNKNTYQHLQQNIAKELERFNPKVSLTKYMDLYRTL